MWLKNNVSKKQNNVQSNHIFQRQNQIWGLMTDQTLKHQAGDVVYKDGIYEIAWI